MKKKMNLFFVLGIMVLALTGCIGDRDKKIEQAMSLLENKYDEEFVLLEYIGHDIYGQYYEILAYPKKDSNIIFKAEVGDDGSYLSDTYIARKVSKEIEKNIGNSISKITNEYYVKVGPASPTIDSSNQYMTIEEYTNLKGGVKYAIYIVTEEDEINSIDMYNKLNESLSTMDCLIGRIVVLSVRDKETLNEVKELFNHEESINNSFYNLVNDYDIRIPFENGGISIGLEEFVYETTPIIYIG